MGGLAGCMVSALMSYPHGHSCAAHTERNNLRTPGASHTDRMEWECISRGVRRFLRHRDRETRRGRYRVVPPSRSQPSVREEVEHRRPHPITRCCEQASMTKVGVDQERIRSDSGPMGGSGGWRYLSGPQPPLPHRSPITCHRHDLPRSCGSLVRRVLGIRTGIAHNCTERPEGRVGGV
jgi:hypothetical protein